MKNTTLLMALVGMVLAAVPALAQEGLEEALAMTPDPQNGKTVYAICAACHTTEAWGTPDGLFPQLAGQSHQAAIKQLMDIRALNRDNPTMYPFTLPETLGGMQNLVDVSYYIEHLPMTPVNGKGDWAEGTPEFAKGKELYEANCVDCHKVDGTGIPEKLYPRINGQHYLYMLRQFEWIRDGKRRNANADMVKQIQSFSDDDMKKVINYVSRIPVPEKDVAPSADYKNPDFH